MATKHIFPGSVALPSLKNLADTTSFSRTVSAFAPQLFALPQLVWDSINNLEELKIIYLSTNPLITAFAFSLILAPVFLVVSEVNRNYSQVDRMWSILPTIYNLHYSLWAHLSGYPSQRLDNLLTFSTVWSLRLTFNYWRRGGYSMGSEDYRWAVVKQYIGPIWMFFFNVVFISLMQSLLLFAITTPTYVLFLHACLTGNEVDMADHIAVRVMMGLVMLEWFADQQQWNFQQDKKKYQETAKVPNPQRHSREDLDRGFITYGLWSMSRHPNFAAEQIIWTILYQWSCLQTDTVYNWTCIGAISYLFLFQGSTWLTELLTSQKYPEYKEYQNSCSSERKRNRDKEKVISSLTP
ncbi:DUF1295-domain-containing protein [Patellaria atrata CBS 101060]|uniref:DUF1295-domain-containing protein n=1 Tax=Patellaria atrata CBS 101060 TaxID=1346257 RepID=A0A9P4S9W4_9PEZI|nr:DUF1295-domain-containing protein [Patellaria atrata CBS 101060]